MQMGYPSKWTIFKRLRAAIADADRLGDIAIYKSALAGGHANAKTEHLLAEMKNPLPVWDLGALEELADGTLGHGYVSFLRRNGLHPFVISDEVEDALIQNNLFVARYGLVHDIFHVLTGFGTDYPGELGVWAFVAAQGYACGHWVAVLFACFLYPILSPTRLKALWRSLWQGMRMGRQAQSLIAIPWENYWDQDLNDVRRQWGIVVADTAPDLSRERL